MSDDAQQMVNRAGSGNGASAADARPARPAEQVGGLDAMFLTCETPTMHMHVCGLLILDPTATGITDPYKAIRAMLEARLPSIPPMRRRLVTVPFNLGRPYWTDVTDIDLDHHLQRVTVDPPGDDRALAALVGRFASTPLRRDRPLWDLLFVEGLAGGKVALLAKMHHSSVDGVSGANFLGSLFDLDPEGRTLEAGQARTPTVVPPLLEMTGRALLEWLENPVEIAKLIPSTVASVVRGAWRMATGHEGNSATAIPFSAPRTSFNATVTAERSVAFIDVSLARVKEVRAAYGVTVNDVITALVSGALRRYLDGRGELPDRPLLAVEPVSVHRQTPGLTGNTKLSIMFSSLATDIEDPVERLGTIAEANHLAKELQSMVAADTLMQLTQHLWLNAVALGARLYSALSLADHHPVIHNLILSNVPGPPAPLYLAGARLVGVYPLGPVLDGAGLNVTALSEEDRIGFGFIACPTLVPDVWSLAEEIPRALDELVERRPAT
jgi:WS/DGAT/MGAT family acyltransferase